MLIYVLIILTVLFFLSWNLLVANHKTHIITSIISTILLLIAIIFSIANFNHHYGMHLVNHTRTEKLASLNKTSPMLIYEKLGSAKKNQIVVYKHSASGKKLHTTPDTSVKNQIIKANVKQPVMKVTYRDWEYKSNAMRAWFGLAQKHSRAKTINRFYVPKNWNALSVQQVKALGQIAKRDGQQAQKQMASPQAKALMAQKAQAYVKAQLMKAMKKDPHMSQAKQKTLTKQATKQFNLKLKSQAAAKIMPKSLAQAKAMPEGYAK